MNRLPKRLLTFLSQDVARHNAATAAGRVTREREQRAEVAAYLAQADRQAPSPPSTPRRPVIG